MIPRVRLTDEITIVTNTEPPVDVVTLPAYVGQVKSLSPVSEGMGTYLTTHLTAIVQPTELYDPALHRVRHRGVTYRPEGAAIPAYRHGVHHHTTIPLQLNESV